MVERQGVPGAVASQEISLVEIASAILRRWRLVLFLPLVLALAAAAHSLTRDRLYEASASFMPQVGEPRGAGGAAALAQQFGVTFAAERPGQSPQFFADLLRTRTLLQRTVAVEYDVMVDGAAWRGPFARYIEMKRGKPFAPGRDAVDELRRLVNSRVSRETGVVTLTVRADDPLLAENVAGTILELLNEFNLELQRVRAREEGRFIGERIGGIQGDLSAAETELQQFLRQNRQFRNSPELIFEHDRLQRAVMMRQEVYTSLLRSREQAEIDGVRDTPVFAVIDHPQGSAEPVGRGTVVRVFLAFTLGLALAVVTAFLLEFVRRGRQENPPPYREFEGLASEAWRGIRNPSQWLPRKEQGVG